MTLHLHGLSPGPKSLDCLINLSKIVSPHMTLYGLLDIDRCLHTVKARSQCPSVLNAKAG